MQGSGFRDRQWLIERDGQFLQVPELLYRVAEQANGERTLEDIAARVTETTDWLVSADNVRQIVELKLIPLGLVTTGETAQISDAPSAAQGSVPSPLALNMRTTVVGPRFIAPITGVLHCLFSRPLLIPLLGAIVVAHWWLYGVHGIARTTSALVYTPGLLPIALAILLLASVFHEFGHAAALRHGGGEVRGMGVGLYLIFPALYTDTTDSYRLGRWARVRTDLGGFYFHLIFALGIVGLYALTGQEFLLFLVVLIDLEIIGQSIPFVRFDGYWALADLTGIPDFFSQIGPFLRSVLPGHGARAGKLPNLKPWVKRFFVIYLIVTIPVLSLLFFLMIRNAPRIVTSTWDAFLIQREELVHPQRQTGFLGMVASVIQMIILPLPLLGTIYLLAKMGWGALRALWRWSKHMPVRQVASLLCIAGSVALVANLWLPQLPFTHTALPDGVQSVVVPERTHVTSPVVYPQTPPVGGSHAPVWLNCGFYAAPVANENAVHSLEHGAVWITYRPDLNTGEIDTLRVLAHDQTYVIASPFPDLPAPVVASAWGRQLRLDSADDPRLEQFVRAFRLGPQAPERGGPCTGGSDSRHERGDA